MFKRPWHQLPIVLGLLKLVQFRDRLRKHNLHDTSQLADLDKLPKPNPSNNEYLQARTADGSYNDLERCEMGMAGTRFGRNVPLEEAQLDQTKLLVPNPRLISNKLLARAEFVPAEILCLLAAAWIQFETHDWFSHGNNQPDRRLVKANGEAFDLAAVDILRDRERGVPRYRRFRELLGRGRINSFEEICPSKPQWAQELREIYNDDLDSVDLMIGMYAEDVPEGFGFSDTAFRVFILMASRRLRSDRFFTKDYRAEIYTQWGLDWIEKTTMTNLLLRHYPDLAPALRGVDNAFAPWRKIV
jgi:hypothetical protein